jgi:Fe-S cluster assembly protein SufB
MNDTPAEQDAQQTAIDVDRDKGNFRYKEDYAFDAGTGLTPATVDYISGVKGEPEWVREYRHKALSIFESMPMPTHWATRDLESIKFEDIRYYLAKGQKPSRTWEEVPDDVKQTFERLGIPESERKFLAGVEAQFDSEAAYSNMKADLEKLGVIFVGPTEGLRDHAEIFRRWFGKVIPASDNKFAALNSAVFSGGSFIYIPKGVKVRQPLQAYFRINAENFGQFERTLNGRGWDKVRTRDVERWVHDQRVAPLTRKTRLATLRPFFRWLLQHGHIAKDPCIAVDPPKVPPLAPRALPR